MNLLMRKLLERQGIYMNAVTGDGGEGGSAGGDTDTGGDAGQATGGDTDAGNGEGEGADGDSDAGDGDKQGQGEGKAGDGDSDKAAKGPSDSEAKLLKEAMKWKDKARDAEKAFKAIQEQLGDIDPATARKLAEEAKDRQRTELEKKGEYDRILQQMRDENKKLIDAKDTQLSDVQTQLAEAHNKIKDLTVGTQFRSSEFIAKQSTLPPTIAQKEFGDYFEFEDGQMVPYNKPRGDAERTPLVDVDGNPKSFDKAIAELYAQHPEAKSLIKTTVKAGAGSKNQADLSSKDSKSSELRGISKIEAGLKAQTSQ